VPKVAVPGSKSVTARALFLAAAAKGTTTLRRPLFSDDTEGFVEGLTTLGYAVERDGDDLHVKGSPEGPTGVANVFCRDGATTARFLPALSASGHGQFSFDASNQMRKRPMSPLLDALGRLGASITPGAQAGHHPFTVNTDGLEGGEIELDAGISSQFLTALLLVGPLTRKGLDIRVTDLVSRPYVDMTLSMMADFGINVVRDGDHFRVPSGAYESRTYCVEPDASSSSYFFAAAALLGVEVQVEGLGTESLQGDLRFVDVLKKMGANVHLDRSRATVSSSGHLQGVEVNMRDISDTMPTLAALAPFAKTPTLITDVFNTRVKECDRLEACAVNLSRMGIKVETGRDWLRILPGLPKAVEVETFGDHRIAMAFSITGLKSNGVMSFDDPGCVKKTFPTFFTTLEDFVTAVRTPY
jgi:3-phosphoshikimate 1-carboxyvinyltransferase